MKERLDIVLVQRKLAASREKAKSIIMEGLVYVNGQKSDKPGTPVKEDDQIEIRGEVLRYVSRGGKKLEKAMQVFRSSWMGASASTSAPPPAASPTACCKTVR